MMFVLLIAEFFFTTKYQTNENDLKKFKPLKK